MIKKPEIDFALLPFLASHYNIDQLKFKINSEHITIEMSVPDINFHNIKPLQVALCISNNTDMNFKFGWPNTNDNKFSIANGMFGGTFHITLELYSKLDLTLEPEDTQL